MYNNFFYISQLFNAKMSQDHKIKIDDNATKNKEIFERKEIFKRKTRIADYISAFFLGASAVLFVSGISFLIIGIRYTKTPEKFFFSHERCVVVNTFAEQKISNDNSYVYYYVHYNLSKYDIYGGVIRIKRVKAGSIVTAESWLTQHYSDGSSFDCYYIPVVNDPYLSEDSYPQNVLIHDQSPPGSPKKMLFAGVALLVASICIGIVGFIYFPKSSCFYNKNFNKAVGPPYL